MKKGIWIIVFTAILLADLVGIQLKIEEQQYIIKPLLIPVLIIYFLSQRKNTNNNLAKWIVVALFFSWAGDVLLMFDVKNSLFFLFGLSAFLLAHIFYIVFFHNIRIREHIKSNPWLLVVVV